MAEQFEAGKRQKDSQLQQKISIDADLAETNRWNKVDAEDQDRKEKWRKVWNENQGLAGKIHNASKQSKLMDLERLNHVNREENAYKMEEDRQKREKDEQKQMYKQTLDNQVMMHTLNKGNYGKMTYQEKKLNRVDLHSYKKKDLNTVHCMIPGIKNIDSVASKPLQRGAIRMMEDP